MSSVAQRLRPLKSVLNGSWLVHRATDNARRAMVDIDRRITERSALRDEGARRLVVLSPRETVQLLESQSIGRLAYLAREGVPDLVPVNYLWHDGGVLIRSGPGPKLQAAQRGDVVAFEVDELDEIGRTGCSAVVVGPASVVESRTWTHEVRCWAGGPHHHLIRINPTRLEGRRLQ